MPFSTSEAGDSRLRVHSHRMPRSARCDTFIESILLFSCGPILLAGCATRATVSAHAVVPVPVTQPTAADVTPTTNSTSYHPARTIVFVCDAGGSMGFKMPQLKHELMQAVNRLLPIQSFDIVFYQGDDHLVTLSDTLLPAAPQNKRKASAWLDDVVSEGPSDPVVALTFAMKLKPQRLYFLTDAADFLDVSAVENVFRKLNADHQTRVNTILFVESKEEQEAEKDSEPVMRRIANDNGGVFKWVRIDQLN